MSQDWENCVACRCGRRTAVLVPWTTCILTQWARLAFTGCSVGRLVHDHIMRCIQSWISR